MMSRSSVDLGTELCEDFTSNCISSSLGVKVAALDLIALTRKCFNSSDPTNFHTISSLESSLLVSILSHVTLWALSIGPVLLYLSGAGRSQRNFNKQDLPTPPAPTTQYLDNVNVNVAKIHSFIKLEKFKRKM